VGNGFVDYVIDQHFEQRLYLFLIGSVDSARFGIIAGTWHHFLLL